MLYNCLTEFGKPAILNPPMSVSNGKKGGKGSYIEWKPYDDQIFPTHRSADVEAKVRAGYVEVRQERGVSNSNSDSLFYIIVGAMVMLPILLLTMWLCCCDRRQGQEGSQEESHRRQEQQGSEGKEESEGKSQEQPGTEGGDTDADAE